MTHTSPRPESPSTWASFRICLPNLSRQCRRLRKYNNSERVRGCLPSQHKMFRDGSSRRNLPFSPMGLPPFISLFTGTWPRYDIQKIKFVPSIFMLDPPMQRMQNCGSSISTEKWRKNMRCFPFILFNCHCETLKGQSGRQRTWTHIESLELYHLLFGFRWTCPVLCLVWFLNWSLTGSG